MGETDNKLLNGFITAVIIYQKQNVKTTKTKNRTKNLLVTKPVIFAYIRGINKIKFGRYFNIIPEFNNFIIGVTYRQYFREKNIAVTDYNTL